MKNIKRTYLLLVNVIALVFVATYSTYALFTSSLEIGDISLDTELKYTFKINSNQEFTIGANSKLRFNAIVENDMEGTISYGVYYKMISPMEISEDITIAEVTDSNTLTTSGPIEPGSDNSIPVPLVIINESNEEVKVQIGIRTGYYTDVMTPEDIIYEVGEVLITDMVDSETAGSYQCEGTIGGECIEDCYTKIENGYRNTYCDKNCIVSTELIDSKEIVNLDESGANKPELTDNLVPVMYNGTTWVIADSENIDVTYQWYDYDDKEWANAVLLTETKRDSLIKDSKGNYILGQTIGDSEAEGVLAFYVWIPRYKYKVWNKNKIMNTDSYGAETKGIEVVFEKGIETTGTITCTYSFASPVATAGKPNETCSGNNGDYYTHPAFKFENINLTGIWVGKFELSSSSPGNNYGGGNSTTLTVRTLPNANSWRNNQVTSFWKVIDNMQTSSNIYGLTTDHTKADSHMLTNMEWGAVAYLAHSKYGNCNGSSCLETATNSYSTGGGSSLIIKTGCGPQSSGSTSSGSTCNAYTSTLGLTASTTGNIYGVYDMSSGAGEFVMGNMSSAVGSYTYYASSGGSNFTYNTNNSKYITTYANGSSSNDQTAYNRGRLGDATSEIVKSSGKGWYSDWAYLPSSSKYWFNRGIGYVTENTAGVFSFAGESGDVSTYFGARSALIVFSV